MNLNLLSCPFSPHCNPPTLLHAWPEGTVSSLNALALLWAHIDCLYPLQSWPSQSAWGIVCLLYLPPLTFFTEIKEGERERVSKRVPPLLSCKQLARCISLTVSLLPLLSVALLQRGSIVYLNRFLLCLVVKYIVHLCLSVVGNFRNLNSSPSCPLFAFPGLFVTHFLNNLFSYHVNGSLAAWPIFPLRRSTRAIV